MWLMMVLQIYKKYEEIIVFIFTFIFISVITIKLPYTSTEEFQNLLKTLRQQQSCAIRSAYNRFKEKKSLKEINGYIKTLKYLAHI